MSVPACCCTDSMPQPGASSLVLLADLCVKFCLHASKPTTLLSKQITVKSSVPFALRYKALLLLPQFAFHLLLQLDWLLLCAVCNFHLLQKSDAVLAYDCFFPACHCGQKSQLAAWLYCFAGTVCCWVSELRCILNVVLYNHCAATLLACDCCYR